MRLLILTEYFPNQFKPYFETQFVQFIENGHELEIFAQGKWDSTVNEEVRRYRLGERTRYYPTTMRTLPRHVPAILGRVLRAPAKACRVIARVFDRRASAKVNLLGCARALLLPARAPDAVLMHDLSTAGGFLFLKRLYPRVPVALYFHGGEIPLGSSLSDPRAVKAFEMTDVVFTNTLYSKSLAVRRGCDPAKVVINPVGFNLGDYRPDEPKRYRPDGILRLVSVGRLSEEKGHRCTFSALRALRDGGFDAFRLRVIGDGPQRAELASLARESGLAGHVAFVGVVPKTQVIAELRDADAMILASIALPSVEENQACVLQEAMLMKLVVVTTMVGGVQESTADVMKRFSVAPADAVGLAERLRAVAGLSNDEITRLGEQGRQFVVDRYEIGSVTRALEARLSGRVPAQERQPV